MSNSLPSTTHHYYVDEAGDLTLFNKKGQVLLGRDGVSHFFIVGVARLADPISAYQQLEELRQELLQDPYFAGVPSFEPSRKKTALAFHAKDDLPEVRREVFKLISTFGVKVQVVIRDKHTLAEEAQTMFRYGNKLQANDIYDNMVKRLFKNLLHKADKVDIAFARRGSSPRYEALRRAVEQARHNFMRQWGNRGTPPIDIASAYPHEYAGLQIVDYYLWALQRLYERGEARFFELMAPDYRLIMDIDDTRDKPYGMYYSDANPLHLEKLAWSYYKNKPKKQPSSD